MSVLPQRSESREERKKTQQLALTLKSRVYTTKAKKIKKKTLISSTIKNNNKIPNLSSITVGNHF